MKAINITQHLFITSALAMLIVFPVSAHDFWLETDRYTVSEGAEVSVEFNVGHHGESAPWNLTSDRIVKLTATGPYGERDLAPFIEPVSDVSPGAVRYTVKDTGAHIIMFESNVADITLDADKFRAYAQEEGLSEVLAVLEQIPAAVIHERYSRRAKVLLSAGANDESAFTAAKGQTLEIIPVKNPLALGSDEPLELRVIYDGAPLPGAKLTLESLSLPFVKEWAQQTGADGVATFSLPKNGNWRANVVWSVPEAAGEDTDFETVFASLSFGY